MKKLRKPGKYFAPQKDQGIRQCDHEGCPNKGEYRAPKDKNLKEYYWFCLKHVQEYNAKWNYYDGNIPEEELENSFKRFKSKVKYKTGFRFKDSTGFFDEYANDYFLAEKTYFSREEKDALKVLELEPDSLDLKKLKSQYKKLSKKYHPDVNGGDKAMEEKFKQISVAYKLMLEKLS